jgi:hypothetical protein
MHSCKCVSDVLELGLGLGLYVHVGVFADAGGAKSHEAIS